MDTVCTPQKVPFHDTPSICIMKKKNKSISILEILPNILTYQNFVDSLIMYYFLTIKENTCVFTGLVEPYGLRLQNIYD